MTRKTPNRFWAHSVGRMKTNNLLRPFSGLHGAIAPIAAIWLFLLLYGLDLRPPHHDEGVNGWFVMQMWRYGFFRYDPGNYHGPLFFYLLQLSETFFGKGIVALRLVTVFFAVANAVLVLAHRRFFGRIATWAALAMAFSPAILFYGRYAIHETLFIFFQLMFSYGYFTYTKQISWKKGVVYMTAGFFGSFMIKETFFIFFGTWFIALGLVTLLARIVPEIKVHEEQHALKKYGETAVTDVPANARIFVLKTIGAGFLVTITIFSGFLNNLQGIIDMLASLAPWLKTGMQSGHNKPFLYWLNLMRIYEWPALTAMAAAVFIAWRTSRNGRFWCVFAVGNVLAYSIIPYKTPWLILNLIWPLFFVLGYAIEHIRQLWPVWGQRIAYPIAAILLICSTGLAIRINLMHCSDPKEPYVYTHSHQSINDLIKHVQQACAQHPEAHNMRIVVATRQTWPLPWALSDYPEVYYTPFSKDQPLHGDVLIVDIQDQKQVEAELDAAYYRVHGRLRDAYNDIVYYFKEARFFDTWQGEGTRISPAPPAREQTP